MIGSLTPDLGYAFGHLHVDRFSHRFWPGSFCFCLPAGLALVAAFYSLRRPLAQVLPAGYRQAMLLLCQRRARSPVSIAISLLIGAWTHILLDSISHENGWVAEHLPGLGHVVFSLGREPIAVCELVYAACTFVGVAWLALSYSRWLVGVAPAVRPSPSADVGWSLLLAGSILMLSLISREAHRWIGEITGGIAALMLVLAFLLVTGRNLTPGNRCGRRLRPKAPVPGQDT